MLTAKSRQDANKNGTVPDSHRESKNRPVITKVGNGLRAETVPKGRQSTAGGAAPAPLACYRRDARTPGKVGGLQALKGRRNTSRDFTPGYTLPSLRDLLPPCVTGGFTPGCILPSLRDFPTTANKKAGSSSLPTHLKNGGLLLSRIALQYHRRRRA